MFSPEQRAGMLRAMHGQDGISEAVILQTCNRLEFYLYVRKDFDTNALLGHLLAVAGQDVVETWRAHSHHIESMEAVAHLFEVAAGLDSQMLGENQILAQIKTAYTESLEGRMSRLIFHRLFHNAFRVGKAVRTHTDINCGAVSIGLAAVELAREKLDLTGAKALVIGAGENAELVARYLVKAGLSELVVANRNVDKAWAMTRRFERARAVPLTGIVEQLGDVDVLIASTAATEPVLTYANAEWHLSGRERPLLIIDIAVPRDIDSEVNQFDCVTLYNIDDLNEQIDANRQKRSSEVPRAKAIVDEFVGKFSQWYETLDLVPVISKLTQTGMELARAESKRYAKDFTGDGDKLQAFAESLVKKILHGPISFIKDGGEEPTAEQLQAVDLINKMFLSEGKGGQ